MVGATQPTKHTRVLRKPECRRFKSCPPDQESYECLDEIKWTSADLEKRYKYNIDKIESLNEDLEKVKLLKINYIGVIAGILAFISLALPWWVMSMSATALEITVSGDISMFLYQTTSSVMGMSQTVTMDLWFCWIVLALILIAGVAGIVGSVLIGKNGKTVLLIAGILALLSIIIFAIGLQSELSKAPPVPGFPSVGLFSSGSFNFMEGISMQYSSYLTFGFWLALIAAILAFVSLLRHPTQEVGKSP
jgi:hypothetical protein